MQVMRFVRKLKWVTSEANVHMHRKAVSASSLFAMIQGEKNRRKQRVYVSHLLTQPPKTEGMIGTRPRGPVPNHGSEKPFG